MTEAGAEITGGCPCGALRYRAAYHGFVPYACHCHSCQRRQGTSFALNQQVLLAGFVAEGEVLVSEVEGHGGARVAHHACPRCLTRVWTVNDQRPEVATIRTGTRDDSPDLVPAFHIWTSRMQPWIALPEGAVHFAQQPESREEWMNLVLPEGLREHPR